MNKNILIEINQPICSILILNWNGSEETLQAVDSILKSNPKLSIEIIIIDQGSTKSEVAILNKLSNEQIKIYYLKENLGFSGGLNYAVSKAQGEFYISINNDVEVEDGWLDYLFKTINSEHGVAAVCSNIIENGNEAVSGKVKYLTHIHGCSMIISKVAWNIIGEFDAKTFYPAYGEELDWSYRARKIGFKLLKSKKSIVHHKVAVTSERNLSKKITNKYRVFHRILFKYINYELSDWFSKALVLEFYDAIKNRYLFLLIKAYFYYLFKINLVFKQRKIRSKRNILGKKLFLLLDKNTST